jgi:DNA polymerase elongation subunit (family B)
VSALCNVPINKSSSPVALTESLLWKGFYDRGKVIADKKMEVEKREYEGAYVKEPTPGMYRAVACFDFASLYPSIMRQFNISPESFIKKTTSQQVLENYKNDKNFIVAVTGAIYDKTKESVLKEILDDLYSKRRLYKDKYLLIEKKISEIKKIK